MNLKITYFWLCTYKKYVDNNQLSLSCVQILSQMNLKTIKLLDIGSCHIDDKAMKKIVLGEWPLL